MKIKWSAFFSILALATFVGCGSEQFGTTPQSTTQAPDPIKEYQQYSCSDFTLVKPKVDIIYMIDNTDSYMLASQALKDAINGTLSKVSSQFDYRIIATNLVNPTLDGATLSSATDNSDYRVYTNNADDLPSSVAVKKVITVSDLTNFIPAFRDRHQERGLWRLREFMNVHRTTGLLRTGAYQFVVLISNNFDNELEGYSVGSGGTGSYYPIDAAFNTRYGQFVTLKSLLQAPQFRLFTITARTKDCNGNTGWRASNYSYIKMSQQFGASDNYDMCSQSFSSIFDSVNSSIQQQKIPHTYAYWPVTSVANSTSISDLANFQVNKISSNGTATALTEGTDYIYASNGSNGSYPDKNILKTNFPDPVQIVSGVRHFITFTSNVNVTYPDCIQIKSTSRTVYYGYIQLQRAPQVNTIYVTINGRSIPQSATNGWTYLGNTNIANKKVDHPSDANDSISPAEPVSGFMIQLNGADNYYKSGESVQVNFIPSAI